MADAEAQPLNKTLGQRLKALDALASAIDAKACAWPLTEKDRDELVTLLGEARFLIEQTVDMVLASELSGHARIQKMQSDWVERFGHISSLITQREQQLMEESRSHLGKNRAAQAYVGTGQL